MGGEARVAASATATEAAGIRASIGQPYLRVPQTPCSLRAASAIEPLIDG